MTSKIITCIIVRSILLCKTSNGWKRELLALPYETMTVYKTNIQHS